MNKEKYVKDVVRLIDADKRTLNRIKEDLFQRIEIAEELDPFFDIINEVGHPYDVAKEFNENLELPGHYPAFTVGLSTSLRGYEYTSKQKLFGVPLVHINMGGRYRTRSAKGIIAIGDLAFGVVSIGGVAVAPVSLGGVGVGLVTLGGVAVGGIALGGVAVGGIAIGAVALGLAQAIGAVTYFVSKLM